MPLDREHLLLAGIIVFMGGLIFLRLVAKEKYRRERHLELRLAAKRKEQEEQGKRDREEHDKEKRRQGDSPVATLQPAG